MDFHITIPLFGYIFLKSQKCHVCEIPLGRLIDDSNVDYNMVFCDSCDADFVAEREGWSEYRKHYKNVVKEYQNRRV